MVVISVDALLLLATIALVGGALGASLDDVAGDGFSFIQRCLGGAFLGVAAGVVAISLGAVSLAPLVALVFGILDGIAVRVIGRMGRDVLNDPWGFVTRWRKPPGGDI